MGREIKRVPMDFSFPLGRSFADDAYDRHRAACPKSAEECGDSCEIDWRSEIPDGEGWQLWQTVSDGPTSPVFATADELIEWMSQPVPEKDRPRWAPEAFPRNPWAQGWRREVAERFVRGPGWAPSFVMVDGAMMSGPELVARAKADGEST